MYSTIDELDKKNTKEHTMLRKHIEEIKENMATKKDLEVVKTLVKPKVEMNKNLKWLIGLLILIGLSYFGYQQQKQTYFAKKTEQYQKNILILTKQSAYGQIKAFKMVDSISFRMKEQSKKIDYINDTLFKTIFQINKFYISEWKNQKILSNIELKRIKNNEKELQNHEHRIQKIENKLDIDLK